MYCRVCGYGGELKTLNGVMVCPRCHATGSDLVNISAMAQGPIWKIDPDDPEYGSLYAIDAQRDSSSGYTNPNLHRRAELSVEGHFEEMDYPYSEDVSAKDFQIDTIEDIPTITKYKGDTDHIRIPDIFADAGYTTIGIGCFTDTDVVYVEIPEGVTTIE